MTNDVRNVFVNAPFDENYLPLFEALVFVITACGYRVRCALEDDDSGDIRLEKLIRLIRECSRSIHDLSRTELSDEELPRFNMPFELGLAIGAKRFGTGRRNNAIKIMVADPYKMPTFLSDLAGNDPSAHRKRPEQLIKIVRDFLHQSPDGVLLPGPVKLATVYNDFRRKMPDIAKELEFSPDEVSGLKSYRIFLTCVVEFLKAAGPTTT